MSGKKIDIDQATSNGSGMTTIFCFVISNIFPNDL